MKKLIFIMLLFMVVQISALTLTDDLVFKGINEDNVFTTLVSNKADITGGESIFIIDNPFKELDLNKTLFFDWYIANGFNYTSYGFEIGEVIEESNPIYEWNDYNYTCYYVDNITLETLNDTCRMSLKNQTGVENISHLIWTKNTTVSKGTHMIKFKATWGAHLGPQETDWVPNIFLKQEYYSLPNDIELRKSIWAWYNTSWDHYKEYTNLTGNISYMFINATVNDNSDFNDTRFISCYNDSLVFNHTLEAKFGTFGQFRVNNLGENCTRRYYGNAAATSTSSASDVYFNPVSTYYFDANANDFVGSNDGTVSGTTLTTGYINGSYNFDGTNDLIESANNLAITGASSRTINFWVKLDSLGQIGTLILMGDRTTVYDSFRLQVASDNKIYIDFYGVNVGGNGNTIDINWHMITATYDGTTAEIFVDKVSQDSKAVTLSTTLKHIFVGGESIVSQYFNGSLDEISIYDFVLSEDQITQLYTQTAPNFIEGAEQSSDSPPTYSGQSVNNTVANKSTKFSILWDDDIYLNSSGQYIFSTNNSGTWNNDSAINFTITPSWANVTKILNSTEGISIGYRWYASDNAGNSNFTEIFNLTTELRPFNSVWNTSVEGSSGIGNITLPLESGGTYDFIVDWGDGNSSTVTSWDSANKTHVYSSPAIYNLTISGTIIGFRFNNGGDKLKILDISQWGVLNVGNNGSYFYGCSNLDSSATDALNLSGTTLLEYMFAVATSFNGNISNWDVSNVTDMSWMFNSASAFNKSIGNWNVSSVTNMDAMFYTASAFNQDLTNWCVSNIASEPTFFSVSSPLTSENKPVWGTCPIGDSCTYTSGNWEIDCSDNCVITSLVNLGGNDMLFSNAGTFWISADIINYGSIELSNDCNIIFDDTKQLISS